jgi:hypothetical protein
MAWSTDQQYLKEGLRPLGPTKAIGFMPFAAPLNAAQKNETGVGQQPAASRNIQQTTDDRRQTTDEPEPESPESNGGAFCSFNFLCALANPARTCWRKRGRKTEAALTTT